MMLVGGQEDMPLAHVIKSSRERLVLRAFSLKRWNIQFGGSRHDPVNEQNFR
jgi:hypothetical protein